MIENGAFNVIINDPLSEIVEAIPVIKILIRFQDEFNPV